MDQTKFDFDTNVYSVEECNIIQNSFIVIASRRASGKSVLVKNLIKYLIDNFEFNFCSLFTDTFFNNDYDFIDKELVFTSDQLDEKIKKLLQIQEKNIKKNKIIHGLIILDDVKVYKKSNMLIDLATKARHYKLTVICSVQFPKMLITTSIRSNIDYLFFSDLNEQGIRAVYESTAIPINFKTFLNLINEHNTDYKFFFYNSKESDKKKRLKLVKSKQFSNLKFFK